MAGTMVEFASNGSKTEGYLALPESGHGPGVVVIQEWWGLVPHISDVADRFAREGFVALAPDLYHGEKAGEPDTAGKLMMALNIDRTAKDLRGACEFLAGQDATTGGKVGVIGFCMGGQLALYAGTVDPEHVNAVADFYGIHPNVQPELERLKAPILGAFAEHDDYASPAAVHALEQRLHERGVTTDFKIYPGTRHGFFNDTIAAQYDEAAAKDAWERTLRFFRAHVG